MNLELCRACPFCETFPKPGAPLNDQGRRHYFCEKAGPHITGHGAVFDADNPTNFLAEEFDERAAVEGKLVVRRVVRIKDAFRVPAECPRRNEH